MDRAVTQEALPLPCPYVMSYSIMMPSSAMTYLSSYTRAALSPYGQAYGVLGKMELQNDGSAVLAARYATMSSQSTSTISAGLGLEYLATIMKTARTSD